jgi:hypothetical protein
MSEASDRAMSELSDEAFDKFVCASDNFEVPFFGGCLGWAKMGWNECRRRAEEILEQERRKYFEGGIDFLSKEDGGEGIAEFREEWIDEAYRAYQAAQEKA